MLQVFHWFFPLRLVRLSSSSLNYVIIAGALIMYISIILYILPVVNQMATTILCNVSVLLACLCDINFLIDKTKVAKSWILSLFWNYTSQNVESVLHIYQSHTEQKGKQNWIYHGQQIDNVFSGYQRLAFRSICCSTCTDWCSTVWSGSSSTFYTGPCSISAQWRISFWGDWGMLISIASCFWVLHGCNHLYV